MHANKQNPVERVEAGDIAAAVGFKDIRTGDTLCAENHPIVLESMKFPAPVILFGSIAKEITGSGNFILSSTIGCFSSHKVSPVRISLKPTAAAISPASTFQQGFAC